MPERPVYIKTTFADRRRKSDLLRESSKGMQSQDGPTTTVMVRSIVMLTVAAVGMAAIGG